MAVLTRDELEHCVKKEKHPFWVDMTGTVFDQADCSRIHPNNLKEIGHYLKNTFLPTGFVSSAPGGHE